MADVLPDSRESIRDQLEKGWVASEAAPEQVVAPELPLGPPEKPLKSATPEPAKAGDKPRAPDGKFVSGEKTLEKPPETKVEAKPEELKPEAPPAEKPPETTLIKPPASFDSKAREHFAKADPEFQAYLAKREADQIAGVQKLKATFEPKARFADEMYEAIRPYEASIRSEGATPIQAVQSLFNMAWVLRVGTPQQKAALVQNTMRQFGVDPNLVLSNEPVPQDPQAAQSNAALLALQQKVGSLESTLASRQEADVNGSIAAFATEKDASGNPLRPHFKDVEEEMYPIVVHMRAQNPNLSNAEILRAAYDKAVRLNDDIWNKTQSEKQAADLERKKREAAEQAKAAQQASGSVTGSPGIAAAAAQSTKSVRSLLEEGWSGRA